MKIKGMIIFFAVFLMLILVEIRPSSILYSSVFSTAGETEIHLYIQMNTLLKNDKDVIAQKAVAEHQKINQMDGKTSYTLHLYRTAIHYKWNLEYDTLICDESGAIICCETQLGV